MTGHQKPDDSQAGRGVVDPEALADARPSQRALETLGLRWRSGKLIAFAGETSFGLRLDAGRIITRRLDSLSVKRAVIGPQERGFITRPEHPL
jgi:hypothetical protein